MVKYPLFGSLLLGAAAALVTAGACLRAAENAPPPARPAFPAFPGAEGFGGAITGGRGGEVYEVTNLDDAGPGSLRDAVSQPNRIIVFRVSGTIALRSGLRIAQPNLTIAGQTAPGDGICLRNYMVSVNSRNVILRYLRFRLGDESAQESDGFDVANGARDVIVDHCSASWSVDEALSLAGNETNVTIQWCLIGEGLNHSLHAKGAHGYGTLGRSNGLVTFHHNLWSSNNSRNPRMGDNYGRPPFPTFDFRNNVIYNYGETASGLTQGQLQINYVGNYIRPGPSSRAKTPITIGGPSAIQFFIRDNVFEGHDDFTADNKRFPAPLMINGTAQFSLVDTPFVAPPVRTTTALQAYEEVLAGVGASLPARDTVDRRIVAQVRNRTGSLVDSQNQVGGWPVLNAIPAPPDGDHDGMPDAWEVQYGFDPKNPADGPQDFDQDGFTNVEEFLNHTDPKVFVDYRDPKNNVSSL